MCKIFVLLSKNIAVNKVNILVSTECQQSRGRVRLPTRMNFQKSSKGGGVHFHSKNLCCRSGLHNLCQPGSRAVRKWRENKKMKRKWRENEEMERDLLSTFPYFLFKASLSIHFPSWSVSSQEEGKIFLNQMVGD